MSSMSGSSEDLCYGSTITKLYNFFQCGDCLYTSESDVDTRQILTYKDGHRAERVSLLKVFETTLVFLTYLTSL